MLMAVAKHNFPITEKDFVAIANFALMKRISEQIKQ